ncbi:MAG: hypothetical protein Q8N22_00500 [bacterium]|nr:hypothetical protein [bacterium]
MIDTKLIDRAKEKSKVIAEIDSSWRKFVGLLKENTFAVPFKADYAALVKDGCFLVEGYSGPLFVDKLCCKGKAYQLKKPVAYYPFRIYGVYDSGRNFQRFVAAPEMGFHYLGLSNEGHGICTGDIQYVNPDSLPALKEVCLKIARAFRVINLESLGTVFLPEEYASLRNILSDKDTDSKIKLEKLLSENLIAEIL